MARTTLFHLPARMTVAHAQALHGELLPLSKRADLTLDASAVDSVGVAGLQLLAALVRDRGNRPTHWRNPSLPLLDAARMSGLTKALALPADDESAA